MVPTSSNVRVTSEVSADLDLSPDLARLVERVRQNEQPWVVVAASALTAWEKRDPTGWAKVSGWLAAHGVAIVRV